jgi:hypothetical protein
VNVLSPGGKINRNFTQYLSFRSDSCDGLLRQNPPLKALSYEIFCFYQKFYKSTRGEVGGGEKRFYENENAKQKEILQMLPSWIGGQGAGAVT